MEIPQAKLEELATWIAKNLKCQCNLTIKESRKEPCACSWTPIVDWFDDNCGITLKVYRQRLDAVYREYEYFQIFKGVAPYDANDESLPHCG